MHTIKVRILRKCAVVDLASTLHVTIIHRRMCVVAALWVAFEIETLNIYTYVLYINCARVHTINSISTIGCWLIQAYTSVCNFAPSKIVNRTQCSSRNSVCKTGRSLCRLMDASNLLRIVRHCAHTYTHADKKQRSTAQARRVHSVDLSPRFKITSMMRLNVFRVFMCTRSIWQIEALINCTGWRRKANESRHTQTHTLNIHVYFLYKYRTEKFSRDGVNVSVWSLVTYDICLDILRSHTEESVFCLLLCVGAGWWPYGFAYAHQFAAVSGKDFLGVSSQSKRSGNFVCDGLDK